MKKFISLFLALALIITLAGPAQIADAAKTRYIIKADVVYDIFVKEKITLYVDTSKKLIWSTSNKKIATVSSKGVVAGKTPGNVTITATAGTKKYKCKVVVWSPDEEVIYSNDVAPAKPTDRYAASEYDLPTDNKSSNRNIDGIEIPATTEDESSEYGETPEWIGNKYLSDVYDITINWSGTKTYLIYGFGKSYIITGTPTSKFESGKVYEGKYNEYTIRFKYENEILINTVDLNAAGIIKIK